MKSKMGMVDKMLDMISDSTKMSLLRRLLSCFLGCGMLNLPEELLREEIKVQGNELIKKSKIHFVLVHGSCVAGWCWYKLTPLLQSVGFSVTAIDLAASGRDPREVGDLKTIWDYFQPLMLFLESTPPDERVILVGHSMGGVATAVAMENFPHKIAVAVFLTAYMPGPKLTPSQIDQMFNLPPDYALDTTYTYANGLDKPPTSFLFGPRYMATRMYQFSPPEDLALANSLCRPFPSFNSDETSSEETTLTPKNYGSVHRVFIMSGNDNGINKNMQLMMIEKNPPDEVREIPYSDHMVMCSEPVQLFSHLLVIADKYI